MRKTDQQTLFIRRTNTKYMKCEKEGYSKHHAETLRKNIYSKSRRNAKLRIYFCNECHLFHLTSAIGMTYKDD